MKNNLAIFWVILQKEIQDNLRDRRSMISGIASALFTPALVLFMIIAIGKALVKDQIENPLELPVAGADNAPALVAFLSQQNVVILPAPADPVAAVREGDVKIVLVIPPDYGVSFERGETAVVQLIIDTSRQSSVSDISRATRVLQAYGSVVGSLRLIARGVDPKVIMPISIQRNDIATPDTQSQLFLNMLPYFVILMIFSGGQHIILDGTAGEKERSSLEPLLICPAPRWVVMTAKMAAAVPFTIFILSITLLGFGAAFNLFPLEEYIGMQLTVNPLSLFWVFLICLPLILLACSVQMIFVTFARSQKEAQTYTSLTPIFLALPGLGMAFMPVKPSTGAMLIPTFGQQILITQLLRSEMVNPMNIFLSALSTLVVFGFFSVLAGYLYTRERIIFGAR